MQPMLGDIENPCSSYSGLERFEQLTKHVSDAKIRDKLPRLGWKWILTLWLWQV